MAKRQCKKGWGCGKTCISRKRACSSEIGPDGKKFKQTYDQYVASLAKSVGSAPTDVAEEKPELEAAAASPKQQEKPKQEDTLAGTTDITDQQQTAEKKKEEEVAPKPELSGNITRAQAAKKFDLLGEGIEGVVYADRTGNVPKAVKYINKKSEELLKEQTGDEAAAKELFNEAEQDFKESVANLKAASDLGISPKILKVYEAANEGGTTDRVIEMELLDGYDVGFGDDMSPEKTRSFVENLRKAHNAGFEVSDLHPDNMMSNPETGDVKFIDQGGMYPSTPQQIAEQLLDTFSWRPLAAQTITDFVQQNGSKKQRNALKKIQRKLTLASDGDQLDYNGLISETYKLLEEVGL